MTSRPVSSSRSQVSSSRTNIDPTYYPIGNDRSIAESASQGGGYLGQPTWLTCYSRQVPTSGRFDRVLIGPLRLLSLAGRLPISDERLVGGEAKPRQKRSSDSARHAANESARSNLKGEKASMAAAAAALEYKKARLSFFSFFSLPLQPLFFIHDTLPSLLVFCVLRLVPFSLSCTEEVILLGKQGFFFLSFLPCVFYPLDELE